MKISQAVFSKLVDEAVRVSNGAHMRSQLEKELLHSDILFALERGGFLDKLVFQGGTCLRLCYGGNRLSEDLDFAGGRDFNVNDLLAMKECIERYIGNRYGLEVDVKEPAKLKQDVKYAELRVSKWQVAIVTAPERPDLPKQRIKLEVANIPAYTKVPRRVQQNYDFLPDGYSDLLINTESMDEVMADKVVSLAATRKYVRNRDLWDLVWLKQRNAKIDVDLIQRKIEDYRYEEDFEQMLADRIESLPAIVNDPGFRGEMARFLPLDVQERTLEDERFLAYMTQELDELLTQAQSGLYQDNSPDFRM